MTCLNYMLTSFRGEQPVFIYRLYEILMGPKVTYNIVSILLVL